MKSRIGIFFSIILLCATVPTIQAMQPVKRFAKSAKKKVGHWIDTVEEALSGETPATVAIVQLNTTPTDPSIAQGSFSALPKAEQNQIVFCISQLGISNNLKTTAQAINSLAQVNKQLNALINNPACHARISQNLAERFNVSIEEVDRMLQTDAAKKEFVSIKQGHLRSLCMDDQIVNYPVAIDMLRKLVEDGADLNFFYKNEGPALIIAMYHGNYVIATALIQLGADPLAQDTEGNSALKIAAEIINNNELADQIRHAIAKQQKK